MKYDLHVHTDMSDGSYSVEEVLKRAKDKGLNGIGITNHDTVDELAKAEALGEMYGIKVVRGIEISAYDDRLKKKVHILGYSFYKTDNIERLCKRIRRERHKNTFWQLEVIKSLGFEIDSDVILKKAQKSGVLYKQHIVEELIKNGYTDKIYGDLYKSLFKNGGAANRDIEYVDAREAVKAIKRDGGLAVLAHPGELDSYRSIGILAREGLDGIEINHPSHSDWDREKIGNFAKEYGLFLTGGSDYHGKYGNSSLGQALCPKEYVNIFE